MGVEPLENAHFMTTNIQVLVLMTKKTTSIALLDVEEDRLSIFG